MAAKPKELAFDPLFDNNPIGLQVLGICSALAVTTAMDTAFVMSLAVIGVLVGSNVAISLIRFTAQIGCKRRTIHLVFPWDRLISEICEGGDDVREIDQCVADTAWWDGAGPVGNEGNVHSRLNGL